MENLIRIVAAAFVCFSLQLLLSNFELYQNGKYTRQTANLVFKTTFFGLKTDIFAKPLRIYSQVTFRTVRISGKATILFRLGGGGELSSIEKVADDRYKKISYFKI